jgi:hypothetical protein
MIGDKHPDDSSSNPKVVIVIYENTNLRKNTIPVKRDKIKTKDYGSQNFSFLALKAEPVGEVQILRTATATATARDKRNFFYRSNHVF